MKILFVCSGNAHRSPLAEALLKRLRPDLEVDSAGLHVAIPISDGVKKYVARENADQCLEEAPENLGSKQLKKYDRLIVMDQTHRDAVLNLFPECKSKIDVWNKIGTSARANPVILTSAAFSGFCSGFSP